MHFSNYRLHPRASWKISAYRTAGTNSTGFFFFFFFIYTTIYPVIRYTAKGWRGINNLLKHTHALKREADLKTILSFSQEERQGRPTFRTSLPFLTFTSVPNQLSEKQHRSRCPSRASRLLARGLPSGFGYRCENNLPETTRTELQRQREVKTKGSRSWQARCSSFRFCPVAKAGKGGQLLSLQQQRSLTDEAAKSEFKPEDGLQSKKHSGAAWRGGWW